MFIAFLPMITFVLLYVGSGLYFSWNGVEQAFYQVPATVAIIPALILAWIVYPGTNTERMKAYIAGVAHHDIITMCMLFFLAGAFGKVTAAIGSVDAVVSLALSCIPSQFLIIGIFIACALISTAIGTSMGTIVTCAPLAAALAQQGAFTPTLAMATVIGGAMFGDSLSMISDTTIASVLSQHADMKKKFKVNAIVAIIAAVITILILSRQPSVSLPVQSFSGSYSLIIPYVVLLILAMIQTNPFIVLMLSLLCAWFIGWVTSGYSLVMCGKDISNGFLSMHDIALLSLCIGGLSGLSKQMIDTLHAYVYRGLRYTKNHVIGQLVIGAIVAVCDLLIANNTIAILLTGSIAKEIAHEYKIPSHYTAAWLDIFSCVIQGIIPYGAQILLASSIGGISPLSIVPHVYYCYVLGAVAITYIVKEKRFIF